jgi:hypothetical protein
MEREALIDVLSEPERRGPMSMARKLLGRVVRAVIPGTGPERRSERPPAMRPRDAVVAGTGSAASPRREEDAARLPPAAVDPLLDPAFAGICALAGPGLSIVWRMPEGALEGAQAIAHATADLRLRTVRVRWTDVDSDVRVERADHGSVRTEGAIALPDRAPGERVVVAIGLAGEDGSFVAAACTTL